MARISASFACGSMVFPAFVFLFLREVQKRSALMENYRSAEGKMPTA